MRLYRSDVPQGNHTAYKNDVAPLGMRMAIINAWMRRRLPVFDKKRTAYHMWLNKRRKRQGLYPYM